MVMTSTGPTRPTAGVDGIGGRRLPDGCGRPAGKMKLPMRRFAKHRDRPGSRSSGGGGRDLTVFTPQRAGMGHHFGNSSSAATGRDTQTTSSIGLLQGCSHETFGRGYVRSLAAVAPACLEQMHPGAGAVCVTQLDLSAQSRPDPSGAYWQEAADLKDSTPGIRGMKSLVAAGFCMVCT